MQTKKMIGLALIPLAILALFAQIARAQTPAAPGSRLAARLQRLEQKLHMTPRQQSEAQSLAAQALAEAQTIRADQDLTPQERHARMAQLARETRTQFVALLTPAQRREARQMVGQRLMQVADRLGLSPDQRTHIKTILADRRAQLKAIRANAGLTPAEKQAQAQAVRRDAKRQALAVLTPAQREQLKAMAAHARQEVAEAAR